MGEMIIESTELEGVYIVKVQPFKDERGSFTNVCDVEEFNREGLIINIDRCCTAMNTALSTWRGLHTQLPPYEETKLVTCIKGGILDIVADARPNSRTYLQWIGVGLSEFNRDVLYIPPGCYHGYLTVVPNTELWYCISSPYKPELQRGIRYNDPIFDIKLPIEPAVISSKDLNWPDFVAGK